MSVSPFLQELARRQQLKQKKVLETKIVEVVGAGEVYLNHLFPKQRAFVDDGSKRVAALCTRRAGKTEATAAKAFQVAAEKPGGMQFYYAPTRKQALTIVWPKLKKLSKQYEIGATFKEVDKVVVFPNGSELHVLGAETSADIDKALGTSLVQVIIDEAAAFGSHLETLVDEVLSPALADHSGQMFMVSTPGRLCAGYFYEATTKPESRWSVHKWSIMDNSQYPIWSGEDGWEKKAELWLQEEIEATGRGIEDPVIQRNYYGTWVRDFESLMYSFSPHRNTLEELPPRHEHNWRMVIGVDLGDNTAFAVAGYHEDSDKVYFFEAQNHKYMSISEIGDHIRKLIHKYPQARKVVVDYGGLGKMIANDIKVRFMLPVVAAEKRHKMAFIETMNSDFRDGSVLLHPPTCGDYIQELENLQRTEDGEEDPNGQNHVCDAGLYAFRECRHYVRKKVKPILDRDNPEDWEKLVITHREKQIKNTRNERDALNDLWLKGN